MPLYDFECLACGHIFEQERRMMDDLPPCASCGSMNIEKLLSPPAIIFKGKGFYKTDSTGVSRGHIVKKETVDPVTGKEAPKENEGKKDNVPSKDAPSTGATKESHPQAKENQKGGVTGGEKAGK